MARLTLVFALIALVLGAFGVGCSACRKKTDAERAAEERKKADEIWQKSIALLPWRAIKGAIRSKNAPNRPRVYEKVDATLAVLDRPSGPDTQADARLRSEACVDLLGYLILHRSELTQHDEDEFPRLANVLDDTRPPLPAPWYDNPAEHAVVGFAVLVMDALDKGDRVPAGDIVFYELSRAPAQAAWPVPLRLLTRYARAVAYIQHSLHYAAEEELTFYLDDVKKASKEDLAVLAASYRSSPAASGVDPDQAARETLLALGHFTRAYNRRALEREDPAIDDLAAGLASLDRLGIENELTLWGHAVVWQRQGKYDEAARSLDKLAASEYLTDDEKKDIRSAAADIRKHDKNPGWFHQQRTQLAIGRAVLARLGGVEGVASFFVGRERAHRWVAPFASMSAARESLREVAGQQKDRFAGLAGEAGETGKKTLEGWKSKLAEAGAP